jgi:glycosyltransferase involved in cell wall biosynthesis
MKVATFFSDSTWASWTLSRGFPEAVKRLGHEVVAVPVPAGARQITKSMDAKLRSSWPTIEELNGCDAIILNGVEHLADWIFHVYEEKWFKVKTRRIGWFHESLVRPDYNIDYAAVSRFFDQGFLPNPYDAEDRKCEWLPIGVDTEMFQNINIPTLKPIEIGFVGLFYDRRKKFMEKLAPCLGDLQIHAGNVEVRDLLGTRHLEQTRLLAENYRNMEILLNLPSMSNVLVMKVLEAMSCGTCVFTPHMSEHMEKLLGFESGKHLVFYETREPKLLADSLREYLNADDQREQVARQGCELVRTKYKIEDRIAKMLAGQNG